MKLVEQVVLTRGVRVAQNVLQDTLTRLQQLQQNDPVTLFALREHALDSGYPLAAATLAALRRQGLAGKDGVASDTRAIVADLVKGFGLAMRIEAPGRPRSASSGGPAIAMADAFAAGVLARVEAGEVEAAAASLLKQVRALARSKVTGAAMLRWVAAAATLVDEHGAARPALQALLSASLQVLGARLSGRARALFFDLAASTGAGIDAGPGLPLRRVPYWQKEAHPLDLFRSTRALPDRADVVIIGAGLIGGSAALHIADEARRRRLRVVLLDAGNVACQATGRNGGNIEAIPENFFGAYGTYDGFVQERYKFLKASYPQLSEAVLLAQAERIAETIIRFADRNARLLMDDVRKEGFDVDLSTTGWLRLALNEREEQALKKEVRFGRRLGIDMRTISAREMKRKYNLDSRFSGRLVRNNGNFHPFKFVVQEVRRAVEKGVLLYTNTRVTKVVSKAADEHLVRTSRGTIRAGRVVVAVNAFTSELFPGLRDIRPFRSQIVNYAHVDNRLGGITFTAKDGDIYGNFPKQDWYRKGRRLVGTLHLGGGLDTPFEGPEHARPSPKVYRLICDEAREVFPDLGAKVPVRTWAGPMAFVEGRHGQRMPVIGELGDGAEQGVLIAVWCNGYGGTGCHKTGAEAARWALRGRLSDDVPDDVFGVRRLLSDEPLFDVARGGPKSRSKARTGVRS